LPVILAAIAAAASTREALVRDANRLGQRSPVKVTAIAPDVCWLR
jgi:anaerobic C4-dicarboxylate transporter